MDRVRFGRVLGGGVRQAVKTLVAAADAASADNPSTSRPAPGRMAASTAASPGSRPPAPTRRAASAAQTRAARTATQMRQVAGGSRGLFGAMGSRVRTLSGVLWLEVTGVFFALFALFGLQGVWQHRQDWRPAATHEVHVHFAGYCALLLVFSYFTISSFVRAKRRGAGR